MNKKRGRLAARADAMCSLLEAARAIEAQLEKALAEESLSGAKLAALTHLVSAEKPVPLGELAAQCACVRSNITQLVDRLEAENLVRRVDDPADRRSRRAAITPLGRRRQAAGARRLQALRRKLDRALGAINPAALRRLLADLQ